MTKEELLKKYRTDEAHMLIPTVYTEGLQNPFYRFSGVPVAIDTTKDAGEAYYVSSVKVDKGKNWVSRYALSRKPLERLAAAAGIFMDARNSETRMISEDQYTGHVVGLVRMPDGTFRPIADEKTIDLRNTRRDIETQKQFKAFRGLTGDEAKRISRLYKGEWRKVEDGNAFVIKDPADVEKYVHASVDAEMVMQRKNAPQKCYTGAWLRVIRQALGMCNTYTIKELSKPFIVVSLKFAPDYNNKEVQRMALAVGFGAMADLYGVPARATAKEEKPQPERKDENPKAEEKPEKELICADCGKKVIATGSKWSAEKIAATSMRHCNRVLCAECFKARYEKFRAGRVA